MANKTVKKKENSNMAENTAPELLGLEEFDSADLVIPRFKITQPTSQEGTPGNFRNNLTNEEVEELNVVVLSAGKGRVFWSENIDEDPACRSSNGLVPSENIEEPVNSECGKKDAGQRFEPVCEYAKWGEQGARPLCNETINLLCVNRDDMVPFFISLHGTQLKPVRAYLSAVGLRRKSLYEFQATLKLKEKNNGKGKYFVIQFENLTENSQDEKETYRALYFQFAGHSIDKTFAAEKTLKANDQNGIPSDQDT